MAPDGSLTVAVQHQRPSDRGAVAAAAWLPAPAGSFCLTLRLYAPTPRAGGDWAPVLRAVA